MSVSFERSGNAERNNKTGLLGPWQWDGMSSSCNNQLPTYAAERPRISKASNILLSTGENLNFFLSLCTPWRNTRVDVYLHLFLNTALNGVSKEVIIPAYCRPIGFQEFEAPRFLDNRHMKVVRLSALRIGRLYPTWNIPGTNFC